MPKWKSNKRYTTEFKIMVAEIMHKQNNNLVYQISELPTGNVSVLKKEKKSSMLNAEVANQQIIHQG